MAILDTPNRWFPLETHSVRLPLVQLLPPRLAYRYARLCRPRRYRESFEVFIADGTGWRNATLAECLPSSGRGRRRGRHRGGRLRLFDSSVTRRARGRGARCCRCSARPPGRSRRRPAAVAGAALPEPPVPARAVRRAGERVSMRIEIGRRNYLAYLLLSHPAKIARLSSESRRRLDDINRAFNERIYSGEGAREYDRIHRYADGRPERLPRSGPGGRDVGGGGLRACAGARGRQRLLHDADRPPRSIPGGDRAGAGHPGGAGRAVPARGARARAGPGRHRARSSRSPRRGVDRLRLRHPEPASLPPSRRGVPRAGPGRAAGRQAVPRGAAPQSAARGSG